MPQPRRWRPMRAAPRARATSPRTTPCPALRRSSKSASARTQPQPAARSGALHGARGGGRAPLPAHARSHKQTMHSRKRPRAPVRPHAMAEETPTSARPASASRGAPRSAPTSAAASRPPPSSNETMMTFAESANDAAYGLPIAAACARHAAVGTRSQPRRPRTLWRRPHQTTRARPRRRRSCPRSPHLGRRHGPRRRPRSPRTSAPRIRTRASWTSQNRCAVT